MQAKNLGVHESVSVQLRQYLAGDIHKRKWHDSIEDVKVLDVFHAPLDMISQGSDSCFNQFLVSKLSLTMKKWRDIQPYSMKGEIFDYVESSVRHNRIT